MFDSTPIAGRYDLSLRQGKTFRRVFTWTIDGEPVDLSSAEVRAAIRYESAGEPLLVLSDGNGITVDGPAGSIAVVITDAQAVASLKGFWDLSATFPDGDDVLILNGMVSMQQTVTG